MHTQSIVCAIVDTGGPRISWFLVPKWYHEIWGSRILKTFLVLNPKLGPKNFLKSTFLASFHKFHLIIRSILTYLCQAVKNHERKVLKS